MKKYFIAKSNQYAHLGIDDHKECKKSVEQFVDVFPIDVSSCVEIPKKEKVKCWKSAYPVGRSRGFEIPRLYCDPIVKNTYRKFIPAVILEVIGKPFKKRVYRKKKKVKMVYCKVWNTHHSDVYMELPYEPLIESDNIADLLPFLLALNDAHKTNYFENAYPNIEAFYQDYLSKQTTSAVKHPNFDLYDGDVISFHIELKFPNETIILDRELGMVSCDSELNFSVVTDFLHYNINDLKDIKIEKQNSRK